jgi:hypothetical protein
MAAQWRTRNRRDRLTTVAANAAMLATVIAQLVSVPMTGIAFRHAKRASIVTR